MKLYNWECLKQTQKKNGSSRCYPRRMCSTQLWRNSPILWSTSVVFGRWLKLLVSSVFVFAFHPVLFNVYFGKNSILSSALKVYFGKRSILSSSFWWGLFWKIPFYPWCFLRYILNDHFGKIYILCSAF